LGAGASDEKKYFLSLVPLLTDSWGGCNVAFGMNESRVVLIRGKGALAGGGNIDQARISEMIRRGLQLMAGTRDAGEALTRLFARTDRVGIKINTIGGRKISTRPELSLSLAGVLAESGLQEKNLIIWDRTNRELREAGYSLASSPGGLKIMATDTAGAGYETELVSHLSIGSLFSTIQTNFVTASISLAILKDHGLAGITAGMKNYYGAIHNPNKYHDSRCNPYVAELFDSGPVKKKHRLSILDALVVQYHRGPSFHAQWAEPAGILIFSQDPVAADYAGWQLVEKLRAKKGLPSLQEEQREPLYLETAARMNLGRTGARVQLVEDEV
jgi:uncharacterized protein (DUF362 family)